MHFVPCVECGDYHSSSTRISVCLDCIDETIKELEASIS